MKVVALTANQKLEVQDWEAKPLADDECRIRVKKVGICSSDIFRSHAEGAYFYPLVMGHEFAGEIVEVGSKVDDLEVGQAATVFPLLPCFQCSSCEKKEYAQCVDYKYYGSRSHGGYAEYVNVKSWNILPIGEGVSFQNAASVEPISVVTHALSSIDLESESTVAFVGAGFLGLIAIKYLSWKAPKLKLHVFDRNQFKLDIAKKMGAEVSLIDETNPISKWGKEFSGKFNTVVESCGAPETFRHSLVMGARGGEVIWMGNIIGDLDLPQKEVSQILRKELRIRGTWNSKFDGRRPSDWTKTVELLKEGFSIEELITKEVPLDQAPEELKKMYQNKMKEIDYPIIKVMLTP